MSAASNELVCFGILFGLLFGLLIGAMSISNKKPYCGKCGQCSGFYNLIVDQEAFGNSKRLCTNKSGENFCYNVVNDESAHIIEELKDFYDLLIISLQNERSNPTYNFFYERLVQRFNKGNDKITEVEQTADGSTSYTINKRDMYLCMTNKDKSKLDIEDIKFVFVHELTHIATDEMHHPPKFWSNFKLMLDIVYKNNLMPLRDYSKKKAKYCGIEITHNPYFDQ